MRNCIVVIFCLIVSFSFGKDNNILDFGAVPDGKTLTTQAIQKAVDECATTGGGMVTVPAGTYLTNTIFLKNNVNLHIHKGATLLGNIDPKAFKGAVVFCDSIQNAAITGLGVIDGQGFKLNFPKTGPRHHDVFLWRCKNITVKDITLINSPTWVFRIRECDGVKIQGIRIYSFSNWNNDGIDIEARNVIVSDCMVDCDDDAVCLKSENPHFLVENVVISDCVIASNCNAIKFGTAGDCGFRNISISNCAIRRPSEAANRMWKKIIQGVSNDTTVLAGIALESIDGGTMDQVAISNITMTGIQTPVFIKLGNRKGDSFLKNIIISNIVATDESLITNSITGYPGNYVENVILKDFIFNCKGTGTEVEAAASVPERSNAGPDNRMFGYSLPSYGMYVRHVNGIVLENFRFNLRAPDVRPAMVFDDCHQIRVNNFSVDKPSSSYPIIRLIQSSNVTISGFNSTEPISKFLQVEGGKSSDIKLIGNDFSQVRKIAEFEGCKPAVLKKISNF